MFHKKNIRIITVATDEEYKLARKYFKKEKIIKTGVGGINVIRKLNKLPKDTEIINFGYAGSNKIPIGTMVKVGKCKLYHPNVEYKEPTYKLENYTSFCYTSNDFVLTTDIKEPVLFDMELAYIKAMGFKKVKSIKIVSDNLSLEQYEDR